MLLGRQRQPAGLVNHDPLFHERACVRQFWTAEKWVRVTDGERNVRWLGLNLDPSTHAQLRMQAQAQPEEARAAIAGLVGPVAEVDCNIVIEEAPDSLAPQIEQF